MTPKKQIIAEIDSVLNPLGFARVRNTWNRRDRTTVEVVDVQVSKSGEKVTVNVGVLDSEIHAEVWGKPPDEFVDEPWCTVRARIGELVDGLDKWWELSDPGAAIDVKSHVVHFAVPFLERVRHRDGMRQWLSDTNVINKRYPPPILSLAIICSSLGDSLEACEILKKLQSKPTGAWQSTIAEIAAKLGAP